jgi:hypothetical protein
MVLNAIFNNISVISWQSVLLVEETGGPEENHRPVASHWQTVSHNVVHLEFLTNVGSVVELMIKLMIWLALITFLIPNHLIN